jgi:endonuclease/exonuclease/phosphatase family metal-dependent hydrolase
MYDFSDQEVANMTNHLAKSLGYNYYDKAIKTEGETWRQANGIFTHFPIIKQRAVWINEPIGNRKGYDNEHRAYVETVLDVQGTLLTVATTHMSYTDRFESTKRKKQKVNRLVKLIKAKRKNYLLTGGFNSPPDSYTVRRISENLQNIGPNYAENTWTTKPFSNAGFSTNDLSWRLDYIFSTADIKANKAEIVPTNYSDHLPILEEITMES